MIPGKSEAGLLALSLSDLAEEHDAAVKLWNRVHGPKDA